MGNNREQLSVRGRGLTRALNVFIFVILTILIASCSDSDNNTTNTTPEQPPVFGAPPPESEGPTFLETHYRTGHNSYSGNLHEGYRGSIIQQLDAGLRFVELDIHLRFNDEGNVVFKVGHDGPGNQVDYTNGNPDSDDCQEWISVVKDWVDNNQPTEPVILAFDWKSGFDKDNEEDKLAIRTLHGYFTNNTDDTYLYPKDFDTEKKISIYNKRIMVLLSGKESAREYYLGHYCSSDCTSSNDNASTLSVAQMFVEYQPDNDKVLTGNEGELFYARAFKSGGCDWAKDMEGNHFSRLWLLTSPCEWNDIEPPPKVPNLPATNLPYFGWYARYTGPDLLNVIPDFEFETIDWRTYDYPRKGSNPDVAVNNLGHVVEVHKSQNKDQLYYSIGNISEDGNSIEWDTENQNYTHGTTPSVAIVDHLNDNNQLLLVEVHVDGGDNLYYCFGLIDTKELDGKRILTGTITWQGENWTQYDNFGEPEHGEHPSVAINEDNMVVEVHEGPNNKLWYKVGSSDGEKISWGPNYIARNYNTGVRPTVALRGNLVFEAHNSSNHYLWCQIGLLNASAKFIEWKWENPDPDKKNEPTYPLPIDESGSKYPSVALYSDGAVEAHKDDDGGVWWRMGKTSNSLMAVGPTTRIQSVDSGWTYQSHPPPGASGTKISIDASDTHVVLAYIADDSDIYYVVGNLPGLETAINP